MSRLILDTTSAPEPAEDIRRGRDFSRKNEIKKSIMEAFAKSPQHAHLRLSSPDAATRLALIEIVRETQSQFEILHFADDAITIGRRANILGSMSMAEEKFQRANGGIVGIAELGREIDALEVGMRLGKL